MALPLPQPDLLVAVERAFLVSAHAGLEQGDDRNLIIVKN